MHNDESPRIHSINISHGGVPKLPVAEARIESLGILGDKQKQRRFHGGVRRAVCLYSLEIIERLRAEGHPITPGSAGENITLANLDWSLVTLGARLRLGDEVTLEITTYTVPCKTIRASFLGGDFTRISQKLHPGESRVYASVVKPGRIVTGDAVRIEPSS